MRSVRTLFAAACVLALACAARPAAAQAVVRGRVLDQGQGAGVVSALVRLTAEDTRAVTADTTDAEGRFSLALPAGRGPYALRAERLGYVALTVVVTADEAAGGAVWRDLRLATQAVAIPGVVARQERTPRQREPRRTPGGTEERQLSWAIPTSPVEPGNLSDQAALQPGVHADDDGLSFFAQDPSQTRTTLDGATYGATTLPAEALASTNVVKSAFDVSRGQYSGGMVEATTIAGTNLFGAAGRTRMSPPGLQWRPASLPGRPATALTSAEGGAGGPIVYNRAFWYGAFSAARRSAPLVSLENAGAAVLAGLGVDPDSAASVNAFLRDGRIGGTATRLPTATRQEQATGLLRLDWDVTDRHALMLRFDGRRATGEGLGIDPLSALTSAGRVSERSTGVLAQLTSRVGPGTHELRVYRSTESRRQDPAWTGPAGTVRVPAGGEAAGSASLTFGGGRAESGTSGGLLEISDELRLALGGGHELMAGAMASARRAAFEAGSNRNGTFAFNTLEELRLGRPALFTRTLGARGGEARTRYGALYVGDTYRRKRLSMVFGARLEGRTYPGAPAVDPAIEAAFGAAPGRVPDEWGISPRLGWTYDGKVWDLRGGIGEFRGVVPLPALAVALSQTGDADELSLWCVGPAAPAPDWAAYAAEATAIPESCVDGAGPFASRTPALTFFAPGFAAPRTWHAALGAVRQISRVRIQFDGSVTRGLSQPVGRDANLVSAPAFALAAEGGRKVYAPPAAIDPRTGGVALSASRRVVGWGQVREVGADGRSTVLQLSTRVSWLYPQLGMLVEGSYTYGRAWDRVGALPAPGGGAALAAADPAALLSSVSDRERRHDLQLQWMVMPRPWVRAGLIGRLVSGLPYTPRVDGDVNGDGQRGDAAFVFDPAAVGDPALASALGALLDDASAGARACLRREMGRVAERNRCRGPWTSSLDVRGELYPWRAKLQRRILLSVTTSNALGLADRLLHGSANARGWGESSAVDATLLRVRGFDPAAKAFRYEVNPDFGTRGGSLGRYRRPFALTLEARVAVGADPAYQPLQRIVRQTMGEGRSFEELRTLLSQRIPNLAAQAAALDSALSLGLTAAQKERLRARAAGFGERVAPLADSLARVQSGVEARTAPDVRAARREAAALTDRVLAVLDDDLRALREILTPDQWSRLPEAVRVPGRQLVPPPSFGAR